MERDKFSTPVETLAIRSRDNSRGFDPYRGNISRWGGIVDNRDSKCVIVGFNVGYLDRGMLSLSVPFSLSSCRFHLSLFIPLSLCSHRAHVLHEYRRVPGG